MIKQLFSSKKNITQKNIETTLIDQFVYPAHGPGQMWEFVAQKVAALGGTILKNHVVQTITIQNDTIDSILITDTNTQETKKLTGDYVFSSMPIQDFISATKPSVPKDIKNISDGLMYRDFITVGLLLDKLKVQEPDGSALKDNWIYIQERDVTVGRLQIFNNWSPYMVADPTKTWIGMEYFCFKNDDLWNKPNKEFIEFAKQELEHIGIINKNDVIDATIIREEKTYPAYFGTYNQFDVIKEYLNSITNLYPVGRNGMHKYNNMDHSMLTAMTAVDNILKNQTDKTNIWHVNTEKEYHEGK